MQIKVDEDLPVAVAQRLREQGYTAVSVLEQGMGGWQDPALWQAVRAENRFLITADKGFADTRSHTPGTHAGVLLLRPDLDGVRPIMELLEQVLMNYDLASLAHTVTVATPRSIRIRCAE